MRVSVPTACSPNVPAPVRSLPLRQYTHTWAADVPCALHVLPEELDVLWRRDGPSSSGQPSRSPRRPPSSGHPRDRRARSSAPRPFRNVDAPLAAVWSPPSPPCPVYHSLSIVPVGTLTSPGGHGPPASGLPAPQRRAHRAPPGHRRAPRGLPAHGGGGRRRRGPAAVRRVRMPGVSDVRCLRARHYAVSVRGLRARAPATLFVPSAGSGSRRCGDSVTRVPELPGGPEPVSLEEQVARHIEGQ